jgi:penicillin-binding protein 1A
VPRASEAPESTSQKAAPQKAAAAPEGRPRGAFDELFEAAEAAGPPPRPPRWRLERWLWVLGSVVLFLAGGAALAFYLVLAYLSEGLPSVETLKAGYNPPQISRIVAADGTQLSNVFTERRTVIPFKDVPDHTKLAILAAEDAHFYEHEGLNYLGLLRAGYALVRAGGTITQGGSTITQQVVKNILLDQRKTFKRKAQDMILAHRLEQHLTKDEIFGLYLNHIALGHGRYGIEEASRYYFGKHASELNLAESALIAGIVQSPQRLSPRTHMDRALKRRKYVLDQMRDKGFITQAYYEELVKAPPPVIAAELDTQSALCPEAVDVAKKALDRARKEGGSQGGYTVTTTIRPELQVAARQAVRQALDAYAERHKLAAPYESKSIKAWGKPFKGKPVPHRIYVGVVRAVDDAAGRIDVQVGDVTGQLMLADEERYNPKHLPPSKFAAVGAVLRVRLTEAPEPDQAPRLRLELGPQGALVAVDVQSRDIVALVGSYEAVPGNLDRARQARRQPGSSFKPILYAQGLRAREVTAASVLDVQHKGHGASETPPYRISVRNALAHSNNEAAEQLLLLDGPAKVVELAHELGIESKLGADLSLALGSYEVTPLEMANAFATFASGGYFLEPRLVAGVTSPNGQPLAEPTPRSPPRKVLEADEAYLITSLLESVVASGTGKKALEIGYPVAGKTGTTNDVKDAWFVGYSTDLAVAVWVGFDDALPLGETEDGTRTALPAFVDFMTKAHEGRPRTEFPRPSGIVTAQVDPDTGLLPRPGQINTVVEEFLDGTVPVQVAPEPLPDTPPPDNAAEMTYKPDPGDPHELPP